MSKTRKIRKARLGREAAERREKDMRLELNSYKSKFSALRDEWNYHASTVKKIFGQHTVLLPPRKITALESLSVLPVHLGSLSGISSLKSDEPENASSSIAALRNLRIIFEKDEKNVDRKLLFMVHIIQDDSECISYCFAPEVRQLLTDKEYGNIVLDELFKRARENASNDLDQLFSPSNMI